MPKKIASLSRQKDFDKIFRQGKLWRNNLFDLRLAENEAAGWRAAIIVSNKISKKAVARNKIRRRAREILRQELPQSVLGRDLVLVGKPALIKSDFPAIRAAIKDLLIKAGVD